jgi:hypothetical protein
MSNEVLARMASGEAFTRIDVGLDPAGDFRFTVA